VSSLDEASERPWGVASRETPPQAPIFGWGYRRPAEPARRRMARLALGLTLVAFCLAAAHVAWLSDDANYTLRSAINFTRGAGITWNPGQRVQVFTHPAWFLAVSAAIACTGEPFVTTILFGLALSVLAVALVLRHATRWATMGTAALAVCLLCCSVPFVDFSTAGLENPLAFVLFGALVVVTSRGAEEGHHLRTVSLLMAAIVLTRLDFGIILLPPFFVLFRPWARSHLVALWPGAALLGAWSGFALLYFGVLLPTPFYAKLQTSIALGEYLDRGFIYFHAQALADPSALLVILLGVAAGLCIAQPALRALAFGVGLYQLYVLYVGGHFMLRQFFAVPVYLAVLLVATACGRVRHRRWFQAAMLGALVGAAPKSFVRLAEPRLRVPDFAGVSDERGVYYRDFGLLASTRGWPAVRTYDSSVPIRKTMISCVAHERLSRGADVFIVDPCAIGDPFLARLPPSRNVHWRTGHLMREIPARYRPSVVAGQNLFTDPTLRRLYDDVQAATSAKLLSRRRLHAILRLNKPGPYR
jgi:arabinofuranosyltransferase